MNHFEMKQLAYQSQLKSRALQVLLYLIDRTNKENTCFPAVSTIGRELHISISTVKRAMRELVEAGYVTKESRFREGNRGQTSNLYTLFFPEKYEEQQEKTDEQLESEGKEEQGDIEKGIQDEPVKEDENINDSLQESADCKMYVREENICVSVTGGGGQNDTTLNFQFNQVLKSEKEVSGKNLSLSKSLGYSDSFYLKQRGGGRGMEHTCSFGIAEKLLREKEYLSVPDRVLEVDGKLMVLSGLCVYLPEFSVIVHEGIVCNRVNRELQPEYWVAAIVDKNTGTLLYDEEDDFAECVFHRQEEKISLAWIKSQMCIVEGIEMREHDRL